MSEPGQHCIEIERPAAAVFDFASGLHNAPRWLSGVLEVSALGAGLSPGARGPRPGGRYQARLRLPGGARSLRFQVAALLPGELMALQAEASPLRLLLMVRPSSARRTRICWRCELPGGRPERALLAALRGAAESRYAHRSLHRLKLLLEVAPAMRAAHLRRFGPPSEVLEIAPAAPLPEPRPRQVLVRVAASSVNPADLTRIAGRGPRLWGRARLPMIPGRDLSGVVVAAGARVRRFQVGDAVWGATGPAAGAWAEFAAVAESALAPKPKSLSDTEAAALLPGFGAPSGAALAKIGRQVEAERIRPVVDCVLPLAQVGEAAAQAASRRARGQVVLWIESGGPARVTAA